MNFFNIGYQLSQLDRTTWGDTNDSETVNFDQGREVINRDVWVILAMSTKDLAGSPVFLRQKDDNTYYSRSQI